VRVSSGSELTPLKLTGWQMGASQKLIRKPGQKPAQLFEILRDRISNHQIAPGTKLGEQAIADEFKVSRARVREALTTLAQRGLVERFPARGAVVRLHDLKSTLQVLDLRELLEGLAVRLATLNASPDHWNDIIESFENAPITPQDKKLHAYIRRYEFFRSRVMAAAGSPILNDQLAVLHDKTQMIMRRVLVVSDRMQQAQLEHVQVLKAMQQKDPELAELLRRKSISSTRKYLEQYQEVLF
jgi:DNA-binding GntR family transcriptional regulator